MLEVHQRHDPGQDGFRGAGKDMDDQVGRQGAGDRKEAAHAAIDVVVDRAGGRQDRCGFGKGGRLGQHHHHGDQHRHREGAAADAKAHGCGENHRAGHDQADGAGQRGGKTNRTPVQMLGESVIDRHAADPRKRIFIVNGASRSGNRRSCPPQPVPDRNGALCPSTLRPSHSDRLAHVCRWFCCSLPRFHAWRAGSMPTNPWPSGAARAAPQPRHCLC